MQKQLFVCGEYIQSHHKGPFKQFLKLRIGSSIKDQWGILLRLAHRKHRAGDDDGQTSSALLGVYSSFDIALWKSQVKEILLPGARVSKILAWSCLFAWRLSSLLLGRRIGKSGLVNQGSGKGGKGSRGLRLWKRLFVPQTRVGGGGKWEGVKFLVGGLPFSTATS